jgi:hypothetical protein
MIELVIAGLIGGVVGGIVAVFLIVCYFFIREQLAGWGIG